jgi:hypothetical protein
VRKVRRVFSFMSIPPMSSTFRLRNCRASRQIRVYGYRPAPTMSKNKSPKNIHKSTRASCTAAQRPWSSSIGILVAAIATEMSIRRGIVESRVNRPTMTRVENDLDDADERARRRPWIWYSNFYETPHAETSGNKNFWIPSDRKTQPTARRMRVVAFGAVEVRIR